MYTTRAPQINATRSAASIPALLLLVALSGSALASTEIQAPCPDSNTAAETLHAILASDNVRPSSIRIVEASETANPAPISDIGAKTGIGEHEKRTVAEKASVRNSPLPQFTTKLPGIAANDMPRFRRHMFRTDI